MIAELAAAGCIATMPITWRLCFPPFPVVRAANPVADEVPLASFDWEGLV